MYMFKSSTTENLVRWPRFQDIINTRAEKCTQNSTYPNNGTKIEWYVLSEQDKNCRYGLPPVPSKSGYLGLPELHAVALESI
jgi:hypothetical protein